MSSLQLDRRLFNGKLQSGIVYPEFFPLTSNQRVVNLGCGVGPQAVIYNGMYAQMVCVDILEDRLLQLKEFMKEHGVENTEALLAPVEATGLPENSFDRALAIDIIEHLPKPEALLQEMHRLLKPGGKGLITIPVMHDRWTEFFRFIRKLFTGASTPPLPEGHPDRHNSDFSRKLWIELIQRSHLKIVAVRATSLFPPLHLYGVPRFWFTVRIIHIIDRFLCSIPGIKRLGQAWMVIIEKE